MIKDSFKAPVESRTSNFEIHSLKIRFCSFRWTQSLFKRFEVEAPPPPCGPCPGGPSGGWGAPSDSIKVEA